MAVKVWGRLFSAFLVTAMLVTGTSGTAAPRYRVRTQEVADGVWLRKILDRRGPNRIRVLTVDPRERVTLDVALATEELPGHEQTTSMARRHRALAAINGDFTLLPGSRGSGRPVNTFIEDGSLKASPLIWGRNFSISRDERTSRVGHSKLKTSLTHADGHSWDIDEVNPVNPQLDEFSLYTPAGGRAFRPPRDSCAARLLPNGRKRWNNNRNGLSRPFIVDRVVCRYRRLPRGSGYVVAASRFSTAGVSIGDGLARGEIVNFRWAFYRPGVLDTIGGNPDLLEGGRIVVGECGTTYFCDRNPRTAVGILPDGRILMVTVDGRSKSSVGMTLHELARLFQYLGATSAINLDGGGSTTMVVRGRIVNVPSGGYERPVGSALLVLPGPDQNEKEPAPYITPAPTPTAPTPTLPPPSVTPSGSVTSSPSGTPTSSARSGASGTPVSSHGLEEGHSWADGLQGMVGPGCQSLLDPGSTGGMLDALERGAIGAGRRLSPDLKWALRVFRGREFCR